MSMTTAQKWRKMIAWLRRNFPLQSHVNVRSIPIKELCGYTQTELGYFSIRVNRNQSFQLRIDTLIHEWAHALTWWGAETDEPHSSEWGLAYAKIYRTFDEWDYGREQA